MMKNNVLEILALCNEMLIKARLMTAYTGFDQTFIFPKNEASSTWFVNPEQHHASIHYSFGFAYNGPLIVKLPIDDSKLMHFFNRIRLNKVRDFEDEYLSRIDKAIEDLKGQYVLFKSCHQNVIGFLREVLRYLCATESSFDNAKKEVLGEIAKFKYEFSLNPILNQSYCEDFLLQIEALILSAESAPCLDYRANLYCMALNMLLEKIDALVRHYSPLHLNVYCDPTIQASFKGLTANQSLFGCSRKDVNNVVKTINAHFKEVLTTQREQFNVLVSSLMLCYCDALPFPSNLQQYIGGDTAVIDFDEFEAEIEAKLESPHTVRGNLIEGQLYQNMDYKRLFGPIFSSAQRNQTEAS